MHQAATVYESVRHELLKFARYIEFVAEHVPERFSTSLAAAAKFNRDTAEWIHEKELEMSQYATVINGLIADVAALTAQVPDADDVAALAAGQAVLAADAPAPVVATDPTAAPVDASAPVAQ